MYDTDLTRKSDPKYETDLVNKRYVDEKIKNFNGSYGDTLPIGAITEFDGNIVPDGYELVSEMSGSNASGNWIKYADGTMICYGISNGTTTLSDYYSWCKRTGTLTINFAQTFISNPVVNITPIISTMIGIQISSVSTSSINFLGFKPTNVTDTTWKVSYVAIGRWK